MFATVIPQKVVYVHRVLACEFYYIVISSLVLERLVILSAPEIRKSAQMTIKIWTRHLHLVCSINENKFILSIQYFIVFYSNLTYNLDE